MADNHPIQKLLDDREQAARAAEAERALQEKRHTEAWVTAAIVIAEAVDRANAVFEANGIDDRFRFDHTDAAAESSLRLVMDDDVGEGGEHLSLLLTLEVKGEQPIVVASGDGVYRQTFAKLDHLLADIYAGHLSDADYFAERC